MSVKIRFSRIGTKNAPFFRIVAIDSRKKRDGAFLEDLGTYNTVESKMIRIAPERIEDWIAKGAVISDAVKRIYKVHKKETGVSAAPAPVKKEAKEKKTKKEQAQA